MGRWSREELEEAFELYQRVAVEAVNGKGWDHFCDIFTWDCVYVEAQKGMVGGRDAVKRWYADLFQIYPVSHMVHYPVEWYIIDEDRGWICCYFWCRMADPGDGSIWQTGCYSLLKYAGDMHFKFEEDAYNPAHLDAMLQGWTARHRELHEQSLAINYPADLGSPV